MLTSEQWNDPNVRVVQAMFEGDPSVLLCLNTGPETVAMTFPCPPGGTGQRDVTLAGDDQRPGQSPGYSMAVAEVLPTVGRANSVARNLRSPLRQPRAYRVASQLCVTTRPRARALRPNSRGLLAEPAVNNLTHHRPSRGASPCWMWPRVEGGRRPVKAAVGELVMVNCVAFGGGPARVDLIASDGHGRSVRSPWFPGQRHRHLGWQLPPRPRRRLVVQHRHLQRHSGAVAPPGRDQDSGGRGRGA